MDTSGTYKNLSDEASPLKPDYVGGRETEAKDTVMSDAEMSELIRVFPEGCTGRVGLMIAKAQAEISFKAGIKEVVGWAKRYKEPYEEFGGDRYLPNRIEIPWANWEAKLKSWGL